MTVEDKKGTENPSLFCVSNSDDEVKIHHLGRVMEDADDRLRMEEPEKQMFTPREQELLQAIVTLNRIAFFRFYRISRTATKERFARC